MIKEETDLKAAEVQLIYRSRLPASKRVQVKTSEDAFKVFWEHWDKDTIEHIETCKILLMNNKNAVLGIAELSKGGIAGTVMDPRIIFEYALKAHASAIIVAHNHPSNNATPSESDVRITKKLVEAGNMLEIRMLDHIVLCGDGTYFSLGDEGRI